MLVERGEELAAMGNAASSELAQARLQLERAVPAVEALQAQAGPLEKAGDRLERIVSRVRRDSPPEPGPGPGPEGP